MRWLASRRRAGGWHACSMAREREDVMPITFPHHYQVRLAAEGGQPATLTAPPRPPLRGGPPSEFGGRDDWWSPEHLLLAAASLCFEATFAALARRERLPVAAWRSLTDGALDRTPSGLAFTAVRIEVELTVDASDIDRARKLLERAKHSCIVSNSLRQPVELEAQVIAAGPPAEPAAAP
jgi:organic hydroperoxide reductase OsmC/OhrA